MSDGSIKNSIRKIAGTFLQDTAYFVSGEVISVNLSSRTCMVRLLEGKRDAVIEASLMSAVDDGFLLVPALESIVKLVFGDYASATIIQYSEVESVVIRGGDLGGLVKVVELTEKLNNIENLLNQFIQQYNIHTHVIAGSAASPTPETFTDALTPTAQIEIENTNIKQG